ncbi:MAG TPA: hypothetical protein HPQ04_13975 [Rhodospirillaceae bacterium]|nr:hypothetical protein [Rhodospirillaceae bacterium]
MPMPPTRPSISTIAVVLAVTFARPALAGDGTAFERDFANAWPHYRDAWVRSAENDAAATATALDAFAAAWSRVAEDVAAAPPPAFRGDAGFTPDLRLIGDIAGKAAFQAGRGRLAQAHATLQQGRAILGELRRRNGIAAYDDPLDEFEDKLAEVGDENLDQPEIPPEQFIHLVEQLGVLAYLVERLEKLVPPQWAGDPAFLEAAEGLSRQVATVKAAVFTGQAVAVRAALEDLRKNFNKFYLYYG